MFILLIINKKKVTTLSKVMVVISICGVGITTLHIGRIELASRFETGAEISPLM